MSANDGKDMSIHGRQGDPIQNNNKQDCKVEMNPIYKTLSTASTAPQMKIRLNLTIK